jgi:hydrogenase maturation factor
MEDAVRIVPEGERLCAQFGINPWGAIASGALLLSVDAAHVPALLRRFLRAKIPAARIGTVLPKRQGVRLVRTDGTVQPVPRFEVDELARLLGRWSVVRGQ